MSGTRPCSAWGKRNSMAAQNSLEIDVFHNGTHRYSKKSIQGLASLKMSGEWVLHHKKPCVPLWNTSKISNI